MTRTRLAAPVLLVAAGLLMISACGAELVSTGPNATSIGTTTPGTDSAVVPLCSDVTPLGPIREGNKARGNPDMVLQNVLHTYASKHADTFAGQWIDREHSGTIVLAFTDDPAAHLAAIRDLRPSPDDESIAMPKPSITDTTNVGESSWVIDVVNAPHSSAELQRVHDTLLGDLGVSGVKRFSSGVATTRNRVSLSLDRSDEATRRQLAELWPADKVCVEPVLGPDERWPAGVPKPTSLIPPEGSDPYITCGAGIPFPASNLQNHPALADDDPLAVAFRESASSDPGEMPGPNLSGYYLLARTDTTATFAVGSPAAGLTSFEFRNNRWIWAGSGGSCTRAHALAPPGLGQVDWTIDGAFPPPGPSDTTIHVLVHEMDCVSGQAVDDRLTPPEIALRGNQVLIAFAAVPPPGQAFNCIGNPSTPTTVTLPEPLGSRTLADGSYVPPLLASTGSSGPIK